MPRLQWFLEPDLKRFLFSVPCSPLVTGTLRVLAVHFSKPRGSFFSFNGPAFPPCFCDPPATDYGLFGDTSNFVGVGQSL